MYQLLSLVRHADKVKHMPQAEAVFVRLPLAVVILSATDAIRVLSGVSLFQPLEAVRLLFTLRTKRAEHASRAADAGCHELPVLIREHAHLPL